MTFVIGIYATLNAIITTFGYYFIKKTIENQKNAFQKVRETNRDKLFSTATECLSTFVKVGACLYCPLAIFFWAYITQTFLGVIEPITVFVVIICANSSGWANSLGYFYNQRLKAANRIAKIPMHTPANTVNETSSGYFETE